MTEREALAKKWFGGHAALSEDFTAIREAFFEVVRFITLPVCYAVIELSGHSDYTNPKQISIDFQTNASPTESI